MPSITGCSFLPPSTAIMKSVNIIAVSSLVLTHGALAQFYEPPPTTADPNTILDCTWWHVAATGDTCDSIAAQMALPVSGFQTYNPSLAGTEASCTSKLVNGNSYCIEQNYGLPSEIYTSTISSAAPTSTAPPVITTPTPHRTLPTDCNRFHFVVSGNLCPGIASQYNIPLATFYAWNPDVGSSCNNLWLEEYVCVGRVSYTPVTTTTTTSSTTTTSPTGIVTPTPHRTLPTNCDRFHFVVSGNLCPNIAAQYNIPLAQFYAWNPDVGSNCNNLWLEEYVCVRTVGYSTPTITTSTTRTTTTTTTGIATPTPHRTLPSNCDRFHFVVSGNLCPNIAAQYNIPLAQFYTWNPDVGSNCNNLWLEEYVCVRTVGYITPTSTTSTRTTTTTTGGISTPTPWQPGMHPNCKQFHKVVSGNTCQTIASQYSITLANFYAWNTGLGNACQTLWLDYYVCVRI